MNIEFKVKSDNIYINNVKNPRVILSSNIDYIITSDETISLKLNKYKNSKIITKFDRETVVFNCKESRVFYYNYKNNYGEFIVSNYNDEMEIDEDPQDLKYDSIKKFISYLYFGNNNYEKLVKFYTDKNLSGTPPLLKDSFICYMILDTEPVGIIQVDNISSDILIIENIEIYDPFRGNGYCKPFLSEVLSEIKKLNKNAKIVNESVNKEAANSCYINSGLKSGYLVKEYLNSEDNIIDTDTIYDQLYYIIPD